MVLERQKNLVAQHLAEEFAAIEFSPPTALGKTGEFSASTTILGQQIDVVFFVEGDRVTSNLLDAVVSATKAPVSEYVKSKFPFVVEESKTLDIGDEALALKATANINRAYQPDFNIYCRFENNVVMDNLLDTLQQATLYLRAPCGLLVEPAAQVIGVRLNGVAAMGTEVQVSRLGKPGAEDAMVLIQTKDGESGWIPTWFLTDKQQEKSPAAASSEKHLLVKESALLPYPDSTPMEGNSISLNLPQGTAVTLLAHHNGWTLVQGWSAESSYVGWLLESNLDAFSDT